MVRFSKFKISLEAEKALYLLILEGQRYANEFCVLARGIPASPNNSLFQNIVGKLRTQTNQILLWYRNQEY